MFGGLAVVVREGVRVCVQKETDVRVAASEKCPRSARPYQRCRAVRLPVAQGNTVIDARCLDSVYG